MESEAGSISAAAVACLSSAVWPVVLVTLRQINRPDSEHIIPIKETFIEFYTVLDAVTGWALQQSAVVDMFTRHRLPHVPMTFHPIGELSAAIEGVRKDATREGAVLYLQRADGHTVGLVKVKVRFCVVLACDALYRVC